MKNTTYAFLAFAFLSITTAFAQDDAPTEEKSNIQNYTPSKLLEKGKLDIKWFNNLYTETENEFDGKKSSFPRQNFFNTSLA